MNDTNTLFLAILKAALKGQRPAIQQNISPEQWQALFHMAGIHNVLPLIYEAAHDHPSLAGQQALLASVKRQVRQLVVLQTLRTGEFLELYDKLRAAGIKPLVVKGIVCRNLYSQPDQRPSSDEDVLIPAEQFALCHRVLTNFGMATTDAEETLADAYEVPYRKAGSPLYIELHKSLFPPGSEAYGDWNRYFVDAERRAVDVEIQGHTVSTLDHTDHLFYLICHAFKHFLHSGFGIRQVCDIVLYANSYGKNVDWARILENCKEIRAEKFAAAMFAIGKNHLVFDPHRACYPESWQGIEVDELPMLEDLLSAGLYGSASMSRKHSSNITLDAVAAQKQGRKARGGLVASVFPSAAKLEGRYPYLKKHPYLLPVAWCDRLWHYGGERRKDSNAAEALKIGSERIELMKYYGILE
jgi:hypothetical protein